MTGCAGVSEEREFSEVAGEICATDTHAVGANNGFAGGGVFLVRAVDDSDFLRFGEFDGVHGKRDWILGYLKLG
jgi:hypothetical protein